MLNNITSLFGRPIDKEEVLSNLDMTESELTTIVIPSMKSIVPAVKGIHTEELDAILTSSIEYYSKGTTEANKLVSNIHKDIGKIANNIKDLKEVAIEKLPDVIVKHNMTLDTEVILKLIGKLEFISEYSMKFANELADAAGASDGVDAEVPAPVKDWLRRYRSTYFRLLDVLTKDFKPLLNNMDNIPDILINDLDDKSIFSLLSNIKSLVNITSVERGFIGNPFYHIGMWIEEYKFQKYKKMKDEKKMLEYKIAKLKKLKDGKSDAKIDKQIEYYTNLVNNMEYKIKQYEETLKDE